jgi:mannitol-1-phosphate/altronate dehydrogenase
LPAVAFYRTDGPSSPHRIIARGLRRRTRHEPLIVFCAENHRSAAALLETAVLEEVPPVEHDLVRERARFVDTVIGKMSGIIDDERERSRRGLATITPALPAAFLVEEFDRILVSRVGRDLRPGLPVLREVDDLAPFEDAKLLGHNATHALAGFLGSLLGLTLVADLQRVDGAMAFLRSAFLEESGAALLRRWEGADPLFTKAGFAAYADDLLARMVNPNLADTITRAARDPRRKLGWDDRLVGLIRLGLAKGVPMPRFAMGVAAGIDLLRHGGARGPDDELLRSCWPADVGAGEAASVLGEVAEVRARLEAWRLDGFGAAALVEMGSEPAGGQSSA